jgi:hypothetical protein
MIKKPYLLSCILFLGLMQNQHALIAQQLSPKEMLEKVIMAMDKVGSARYTLKKTERIKGKLIESENKVKLQLSPHKIYLLSSYPNSGAEVLWRKGENSDNVLVSPNRFPYITISLSPFSGLLRQAQHHTILDLGFGYMSNVLKSYIRKFGQKFFSTASLDGEVVWNSKRYYKLLIENSSFAHINYTVKKGDNLPKLASSFFVNDYMIMDNNPKISDYDDIKEGQQIKIPNAYAQKIIFYIDKETFLPLMQAIYDDKGLYEKFEISNLILNPHIPPVEFTPSFKEYSF